MGPSAVRRCRSCSRAIKRGVSSVCTFPRMLSFSFCWFEKVMGAGLASLVRCLWTRSVLFLLKWIRGGEGAMKLGQACEDHTV